MFPPDAKILVVDDMKGIRIWLSKSLQTLGFQNIKEAASVDEALAHVHGNPVDLIFTDLVMPGKNGMELIKELYGDEKYKGIPIIVLTAESDKQMIVDIIGMGVNSYIIKPITLPVLQKKLEGVFKNKER